MEKNYSEHLQKLETFRFQIQGVDVNKFKNVMNEWESKKDHIKTILIQKVSEGNA